MKKTMTKKDLQREENIKSTVGRMSGFPSWVDYLKAVAAAGYEIRVGKVESLCDIFLNMTD